MEYTDVFSFKKPGYEEDADVIDFNDNMDAIDDELYKLRRIDGEVYDNTTTSSNPYQIGDYVISPVDGLMYECIAPTYGIWDSTKWQRTTQFAQIKEAMQSGGEVSGLDDLDDVNITNPSDGQVLTYDTNNSEWVNADSATPTKTATGNPIELTDGADAPLVKCVTEIQGSQDLHGYDKPWVGGAGKNKVDGDNLTIGLPGYRVGDNIDDVITSTRYAFTAPVLAENGVVVSGKSDTRDYFDAMLVTLYDSSGSFIELKSVILANVGQVYTITIEPNICKWIRVVAGADASHNISTSVQGEIQAEYGTTATSYAPYSNICPITAYTEGEIEVRGKNVLPFQTEVKSQNGITVTPLSNGRYNFTGRATTNTAIQYPVTINKSGIYRFIADNYTAISNGNITLYYRTIGGGTTQVLNVGNTIDLSVYEITYIAFFCGNNIDVNFSNVGLMLVEESESDKSYEPYIVPTTHTTTYPSAIYRGSEDVVKGEVTSDMPVIDLGDLSWSAYTTDTTGHSFYVNVPTGVKSVSSDSSVANMVCENYETVAFINPSEWLRRNAIICQVPNAQRWIVRDERYSDATAFTTAMNGVQLAYELATPTTSSVTPTNLPIKSLSGYTHIESSTGEMEIEYITQAQQPLIDLIRAEKGDTYSTSEQIIGKWIDGSILYRRTYEITVQSPSAPYTEDISISGLVVVGIEKHYANYQYSGTWYYESGDQLNGAYLSITQKDETGTALTVSSNMGSGLDAIKLCFSISYTKTASNNRSLAKSAPETKEEQVEELKEEPTEEVKEEPEEIKESEELKEEVKEPEEKVEEEKEEVKEEESK